MQTHCGLAAYCEGPPSGLAVVAGTGWTEAGMARTVSTVTAGMAVAQAVMMVTAEMVAVRAVKAETAGVAVAQAVMMVAAAGTLWSGQSLGPRRGLEFAIRHPAEWK